MTLLSFIILEIRVVIMITKLTIRNFKKFDFAEIELTPPVVFIGPNNSGKTTALQALSLWETGYRKWVEKRGFDKEKQPKERAGITINRRDLTAIPISVTKNIWKNLHTHQFNKDKRNNEKIYIDIIVEGYNELENKQWECGFEFYYANEESFYCRPLRLSNDKKSQRMPVPEINDLNIAFLPPMSGLVEQEFHKQPGEIEFLIGQGQTAEVLRNLCYKVYTSFPHNWEYIVEHLSKVFGIKILSPDYTERNGPHDDEGLGVAAERDGQHRVDDQHRQREPGEQTAERLGQVFALAREPVGQAGIPRGERGQDLLRQPAEDLVGARHGAVDVGGDVQDRIASRRDRLALRVRADRRRG